MDNTAPTISIGTPSAAYVAGGPVTYTVTYADANFNSSNLALANISLDPTGTANGTIAVSGSGLTYTVTVSNITGDGSLGISIAAGTATDLAGNLAPASGPSGTFIVDNTAPTISIGTPSAAYAAGGPVTYTVTYADANFSSSDLALANISLDQTGTANGTIAVNGSGLTYTVTVSNITGDGSLGISIAAGTASDLAGNLAPASGPSATFIVDNTAPSDLDRRPFGILRGRRARDLHGDLCRREFQFQQPGPGEASRLDPTGTANGTLGVSGSGLTYTVTVSNITGNGSLGISIAAGTAADLAGNLAPTAGPSGTFIVDNTAPTISIGTPSAAYAAGGPVTYTVTYADANFNSSTLAAANITLNETGTTNGTLSCLRFGPDADGHDQRHHGQRLPGDFHRRRHGHRQGRQHGPGRHQRDLHRGQHGPHDLDRRPLGSLRGRRARDLHGDLCRREFQFQQPGPGQHQPGPDGDGQRHDRRQWLGPDLHGHRQQHHGRWFAGDLHRRRHRHGPGRQPGPGQPGPAARSSWTTRPPRSRSAPPRRLMRRAGPSPTR